MQITVLDGTQLRGSRTPLPILWTVWPRTPDRGFCGDGPRSGINTPRLLAAPDSSLVRQGTQIEKKEGTHASKIQCRDGLDLSDHQVLLAILIAATIIVSFVEVVRRYLFGQVFSWSDEFQRFAMVYIGMVGGAVSYRYGELVGFDSLLNRFTPKVQFLLGIVTDLFSLVLLVICLVLSIQTITARSTQIAISSGLKIPMTVPLCGLCNRLFSDDFVLCMQPCQPNCQVQSRRL